MTEYKGMSVEEKQLLGALVRMMHAEFGGAADIRIIEIGSFRNRTKYAKDDILYGPDTAVVRLQCAARGGEILIRLCLAGAEAQNEYTKEMVRYARRRGDADFRLMYEGESGDYAVLEGKYVPDGSAEHFDCGRLNRALAAYRAAEERGVPNSP